MSDNVNANITLETIIMAAITNLLTTVAIDIGNIIIGLTTYVPSTT